MVGVEKKTACIMLCVLWGTAIVANGFQEDFTDFSTENWYVAEYDFDHPSFDTDWRASQANIQNGLHLNLSPKVTGDNGFDGASIRRHDPTGFGRYEVIMQPSRGAGFITGFFTYTGPHYGTRHDEIDIEFLGKDTTQIHLATFVDGKLWNKFIDLGFDAADRPRTYAFEWTKDSIRWFVGSDMIFERQASDGAIPSAKGRLFANIWAGDPVIKEWSGLSDKQAKGAAVVKKMSFFPLKSATELVN